MIPVTTTLEEVVETLRNPQEFVRRVLANLYECKKKDTGEVFVRIGITGHGIIPHYRIEAAHFPEVDGPFPHVLNVYNGANHKIMSDVSPDAVRDEHWSIKKMDIESVAKLLGSLRKKGKARM